MGAVDLAHPAAAEARVDPIVPYQVTDEPLAGISRSIGGAADGRLRIPAGIVLIVR